jgi:regulator of sigma E protease
MMILTYIVAGVVLLGLCIFIHELGHLLGGKMVGIKAKVFSLGYGKGFIKKTIGETTYQITLIPLGGYCQFYGEDPTSERKGEPYEFLSAHPMKRIITVAMGPLFNLFFGIIIFFIMNLAGYNTESNTVYIPQELKEYPAYTAGIRNGDKIVQIGAKKIGRFSDIQSSIFFSEGKKINVQIDRGGSKVEFPVIPRQDKEGKYSIGVTPFIRNVVGKVVAGDTADTAGLRQGDEIVLVNGEVKNFDDLMSHIRGSLSKQIDFMVRRGTTEEKIPVKPRAEEMISLVEVKSGGASMNMYKNFFEKEITKIRPRIEGKIIGSFDEMKTEIAARKGAPFLFEFDKFKGQVTGRIDNVGFIGVEFKFSPAMTEVKYPFAEACVRSIVEPYDFIVMNLRGIGMLFSGKLNVRENLSGPIRIVKLAGDVAHYKGMSAFIMLMAQISIILMVMNFLPIPMVDGSHILFYTIELIRGKPLSPKIMERVQSVGFVILIMLFAFIIINDIFMLFIKKLIN